MILVTGATGNVGSELVTALSDSGVPVRALVHSPHKASKLGPNIDVAVGDLDKPETLRPAMKGVRAVYAIAFFTEQIVNLVEAAKSAGAELIVRQSTIEAAATPPFGPGKWHREQEEARLGASPADAHDDERYSVVVLDDPERTHSVFPWRRGPRIAG
ncbi:MAG: SDR family oxidoreductase [Bauldia sp.]